MRSRSDAWVALAQDGNFSMETTAVINGTRYTSITAPVIERGLLSSNVLSVGNCNSASMEFTVVTTDEIPKSAQVVIECRLTDGTTMTEWMSMGTFFVNTRTVDEDIVTLHCYDAMLKANQAYGDSTTANDNADWPKSMTACVTEIAQRMGVALDSRTTIRTGDAYMVPYPYDLTMMDVLKYIAGCHGGNWIITPDNKLRLVPIIAPPAEDFSLDGYTYSSETVSGVKRRFWKKGTTKYYDDTHGIINVPAVLDQITTARRYAVSKIVMTVNSETGWTRGDDTGFTLEIKDNPYASADICNDLYAAFNGIEFAPFSAEGAIYDPAAELGDWVLVGDRARGVLYVENAEYSVGFEANASAPGEDEIEEEYPYLSELDKLKLADDRLKSYTDAELSAFDKSLTPTEVFNRLTDNGAVQGIYLRDGQIYINANYIKSGEIDAALIKAGILTDANNTNYWNMETGDFRLSANTTVGGKTVNTIVNDAVDNVQVGARNLLAYCRSYIPSLSSVTVTEDKWMSVTLARRTEAIPWGVDGGAVTFLSGPGTYTVSAEADGTFFTNGKVVVPVYKQGASGVLATYTLEESGSQIITLKEGEYIGCVKLTSETGATTAQRVRIQIEEGNKATTWAPAPEDVDTDITEAQSAAEETARGLIDNYDELLNQQKVFNKLTNNGANQGIYLQNGDLYINGTYIKSGTIDADLVKAGVLMDEAGTNYWNMETGEFRISNKSVQQIANEAASSAVDGISVGGRNLIVNTLDAVVAPAASRPRILGQTTSTTSYGSWSWAPAEHGLRITNASVENRMWLAFGYASFADCTINGLTAGKVYTWSFDYEASLLGNTASGTYYLQAALLYAKDGDTGFKSIDKNFHTIAPEAHGQKMTGRLEYTFTVPEDTVKCYIRINCTDATGADYAVGDYFEITNLKLEEGNKATAWTPAPEDYPVKMEDIAKEQVDTLFEVGDGRIVGKVTTSSEWSSQSQNIQTAQNTANTAKTNAATAQSTADSANSAAAAAQTTANTAVSNAAAAQSTANAANTAAGNAASVASNAQTTANQKRRVFTSQPWTPYEMGDMWAEGSTGDLKVCVNARASGEFVASDWQLATKYTDDTKAEKALDDLADAMTTWDDTFDELKAQVDGKAEIWYGTATPTASNAPASSWTTTALKKEHVGDIYYNTANGYCYRYTSSYAWSRIKDNDIVKAAGAAANAKSVADGKAQVFVTQPTPPYYEGDLWVQGVNGDILRCTNDRTTGSYLASEWILASKYTDDTAVNNLQIGGRNLALGTGAAVTLSPSGTNTWLTPTAFYTNSDYGFSLISNTDNVYFTLSFDWSASGADTAVNASVNLKYTSSNFSSIGKTLPIAVGTSSGHFSHTFTPTAAQREYGRSWLIASVGTANRNLKFTIRNFKLEVGQKATDWTPAPEDVDSAIANIQVGGRNLLAYCNSNIPELSGVTVADDLYMRVTLPKNGQAFVWGAEDGTTGFGPGTYTFSVEAYGNYFTEGGRVELMVYSPWDDPEDEIIVYKPHTFSANGSKTFTVNKATGSTLNEYIAYVRLYAGSTAVDSKKIRVKLEKGDKATDWTPAPEDVAASIDEIAGALTNLKTDVQTNYAKKTDVQQETSQDSIWQKVSTKEEYQQQVTITEELNAIVKANDNLFVNLFEQDFSAPSGYPRLIGQTVDTGVNSCTATVAQHGMRVTATDAHRPIIRFGHYSATASGASMNGLSAGNYTLSFDYEAKMFGGSPTGTVYLGAYVFQSADGENFYQTHSKTLETYTSGHYTEKRTGSCAFAFTINTSTVKLYLIIAPNVSTNAFHAAGDYLEATDLKLEEGNKKTPFKLNAQDSVRALEKRVSTNESSITELDDEIALRVTEKGVFEALRDHNYASRNLLKDANAPTLTAVYANLERESTSTAGDRYFSTNDAVTTTYATFTDCPCGAVYGFTAVSSGGGSNGAGLVFYRNYAEPVLNIGSTYTMSCFVRVRSVGTASVRFVIGTGTYNTHTFTLPSADYRAWSRVSWTFTATADICTKSGENYYTRLDYQLLATNAATVDFCGFQLEEGEVATDWTPNIGEYTHLLDDRVKDAELKIEPDAITATVMGRTTSSLQGKTLAGYLTQLNTALGEANFTVSRAGIVQKVMEQSQTSLGMSLKSYLDNLEGDVDDVSGDLTKLTNRVSTTESAVKPGAIMNTVMTTETTDLAGKSLLTYLNTLKVGGRNLFINTLNTNTTTETIATADRPKLTGQTRNTVGVGLITGALHGIRSTSNASGINRPYLMFGQSDLTQDTASMNGLVAGATYTWSFDYDVKLYSGSPSGTQYLAAWLRYGKSGDTSGQTDIYKNVVTYGSSDFGQRKTGHFSFTFTVPTTAVKTYLFIAPPNVVQSDHAQGDYIEVTNLKLEAGDHETDWTPAPEDIVTLQGDYNVTKKAVLDITDESITAAVTREMSTTLGGKDLETYLGDLYSDTSDAMALAEDKRRVFLMQPTGPYDYQDLWVGGSTGDLKICTNVNGRKTGYNANDWSLATKYTDYRLFRGTANPTPPYRVGDMWANGTDLRVCKTAKDENESYLAADWERATAYTDDTTATAALITAKGGRNLLLDTGTKKATSAYTSADSSYTGQYYLSEYGNSVANNNTTDVFTISFDISVTGNSSSTAYVYPQYNNATIVPVSGSTRDLVFGTATTGHHECSFKLTSDQASGYTGSSRMRFRLREATEGTVLTVFNVKLEKGTTATAWDVAPEDLVALEDTVNNDILGSGENSIATRLSNAEIQITPGNITSTVLDQVTNKLVDENGNSTSLINKLSTIEQDADEITMTVKSHDERIKNLNTSARNLFINTLETTSTTDISKQEDRPRLVTQTGDTTGVGLVKGALHGIRSQSNVSGTNRPYLAFGDLSATSSTAGMNGLIAGQTYTWSFDYEAKLFSGTISANQDLLVSFRWATSSGTSYTISAAIIDTWTTATKGTVKKGHCVFSFTVPDNAAKTLLFIGSRSSTQSMFAVGDYIQLTNLMLVNANTPARWEAAPEDLQKYTETQVSDAETRISQTTDSITMTVKGMAIKNLFMNTVNPMVTPEVLRPMLVGQTSSTYVRGTARAASHGLYSWMSGADYPMIRFGSSSVSAGTLNGLEAGKTYTWSAFCGARLFSGSPSGTQNVRVYLYWIPSSGSAFTTDADHYATIISYAASEYGTYKTANINFKFTVPTGATAAYLTVRPQNTTASYFAADDYILLDNLMLVEGDNTGEDKITYGTWIDSASDSLIEQKADSIRLKADKISWSSTNSSMTEAGHLECTGATFTNGNITCRNASTGYGLTVNGTSGAMSWDAANSSLSTDGTFSTQKTANGHTIKTTLTQGKLTTYYDNTAVGDITAESAGTVNLMKISAGDELQLGTNGAYITLNDQVVGLTYQGSGQGIVLETNSLSINNDTGYTGSVPFVYDMAEDAHGYTTWTIKHMRFVNGIMVGITN